MCRIKMIDDWWDMGEGDPLFSRLFTNQDLLKYHKKAIIHFFLYQFYSNLIAPLNAQIFRWYSRATTPENFILDLYVSGKMLATTTENGPTKKNGLIGNLVGWGVGRKTTIRHEKSSLS